MSWKSATIILTDFDRHEETRSLLPASLVIWDLTEDPIGICMVVDHFTAGVMMGRYVAPPDFRAPELVNTPLRHDM